MEKRNKEIKLDKNDTFKIYAYLNHEPESEEECQGEDNTIIFSADFDNGYFMDIKCCGVQYMEENKACTTGNKSWTEAVLFKNGAEVACTDVCDEFFGEWKIEYNDIEYIVNVIPYKISLKEFLEFFEFNYEIDNQGIYHLTDLQGANLGGIEQEKFNSIPEIVDRLDIYYHDYIYLDISDRNVSGDPDNLYNGDEYYPDIYNWLVTNKGYNDELTIITACIINCNELITI